MRSACFITPDNADSIGKGTRILVLRAIAELEVPQTVEVQPILAHHLRPRILGQGVGGGHVLGPARLERSGRRLPVGGPGGRRDGQRKQCSEDDSAVRRAAGGRGCLHGVVLLRGGGCHFRLDWSSASRHRATCTRTCAGLWPLRFPHPHWPWRAAWPPPARWVIVLAQIGNGFTALATIDHLP